MKSVVCKELDSSISFEPLHPHCRRGGGGGQPTSKQTKSESWIVEDMDPRLQGWLLTEPKRKPGPGAFSLFPFPPHSQKCYKVFRLCHWGHWTWWRAASLWKLQSRRLHSEPYILSCHFRHTCSYLPWFCYKIERRIFNNPVPCSNAVLKTKFFVLKPLFTTF